MSNTLRQDDGLLEHTVIYVAPWGDRVTAFVLGYDATTDRWHIRVPRFSNAELYVEVDRIESADPARNPEKYNVVDRSS